MVEKCPHSLEQISIADWEATPASVKHLVSSLLAQELGNISTSENDSESKSESKNRLIKLTQFLDATSVGIAIHDSTGDLVYINQSGKELLTNTPGPASKVGRAEELSQAFQIYRSTSHQPYPAEELPSCLALAGEKVRVEDMEVHRPDRIIPLEVIATPIFNSQGQVAYVIATFQDITHRRLWQQALFKSEMCYQQVVEAQTDFILRSRPDTSVTFANSALCRVLGCSLEQIAGQKWVDFADPEDLQNIFQKILELTPENSNFLAENRDLRADGSMGGTQWINQGIFNLQGELVEIQSVGRDITTLKQTEAALRASEAKLQNITANIPGVVLRYLLRADGSDALLYISPGCYDLWEIKAEVLANSIKPLWDQIHPEDSLGTHESVKASANTLQPWHREWRIITPSGRQKWLQAAGRPECTPEGDVAWDMVVLDVSDRKQVELELHQQKELLQLIFDHMPVMASIFSPRGEVLMINQQLEQVIGWTKPEYETIDVLRECYPDLADYEATMQQIIAADSTWREVKIKVKDGRILDTSWIQIRLSDGKTMSIGQDITDRKQLVSSLAQINQELEIRVAKRTEALQQQEALLRESQQVAHLGSWELTAATGDVIWSPEMFQIFGYDPAQPAPSFLQQSHNFLPEDWQRLIHLVDRAIQFGEPYEVDLQIIQQDGSLGYIFAKGQPTLDEDGQLRRLVGIAMDISDRKQAEQEIIRSRDLQEAIFNESADALFIVDAQTLLTLDCNRRAMELFGVTNKAELISIAGHTLQRQPFTNEELASVDQELATAGVWSREIEYVNRQGNLFWGNIAVKPIVVASRTMHLVRVMDISDRKLAETKIQQTTQQLETANRELETFAYSVSHDLRAPLRAIDGFSKALIEDYGDQFDEEAKDYFDRIHRAVERMGDLIDDLLRLSRVSRVEAQYSKVNLTNLVQRIATRLQESEPDRRVEFAIAPEAIVYADANLLQIALENLLQNAWKFTSHHPTARIEFGITQAEVEAQVETVYFVRDDGAGFDMAYATMLFGVFQRLHNTNEFPGTGIGLATVQRVIHRHGGRVWAEGAVEVGATIYFTLPNRVELEKGG